jgi:hypothetical protein
MRLLTGLGRKCTVSGKTGFISSFILNVLSWLPAYLAYYPAVCSYDMPIQTGQVLEGRYIDHHPLFHTLLLKAFMELGDRAFDSVTIGIGLLAAAQILFLAAVFAYGFSCAARRGAKLWQLILLQLWCMFYPFHWYMSVSITKDTVFTGFFVLTVLSMCEFDRFAGLRFGFASVGMMLFRNNGKYAYLVFLVVLTAAFLISAISDRRKGRRSAGCRSKGKLLLWSLASFLLASLLLSAAFRLLNAEQGDRREMLSLPIQQLARTYIYHGGAGVLAEDDNTMDETDKALVNDFILNEGYKKYTAAISDPVKSNTNTYVARYRAKDFLKTYFHLLSEYPGDFINAALAVNAGYLYPGDVTHAEINVTGDDRVGRGYVQTYWEEDTMNSRGIYKHSAWKWMYEKLEQWADENAYLKVPVLKYLFVPGVWLWFYLVLFARLLMKKSYRRCMALSLVGGYFVTLLLGPAVQLRYLYPLMAAFPFLLLYGAAGDGQCGEKLAERKKQGR